MKVLAEGASVDHMSDTKAGDTQKGKKETTYSEVFNYLFVTYISDNLIAEVNANITNNL